MAQKPRNRWNGWLKRKPSILRPFPSPLRMEELEPRDVPATYTWRGLGATANWSDPANWTVSPAGAPSAPTGLPNPPALGGYDNLVFADGPTVRTTVNDLPASTPLSPRTFNSISFSSLNGGYTLTGNAITLGIAGAPGTGFINVQQNSRSHDIRLNMFVGTSTPGLPNNVQTFDVDGELRISGTMTGNALSNLNSSGIGTLTLSGDNSAFLGAITLTTNGPSGRLVVAHPNALGDTVNGTTVGAGTALVFNNVGGAVAESISLNNSGNGDGTLYNEAGDNLLTGPIVLDAADNTNGIIIKAEDGTSLTINGVISDRSVGRILTKQGRGELVLNAANTYRGFTQVNSGILTLGNALALGAGGDAASGTIVNSTTAGQGQLRLASPSATGFTILDEFLTLNGAGQSGLVNRGSLTNTNAENTWAGPVTLGSPTPNGVAVTIGTGGGTLTISGVIATPNGIGNNAALNPPNSNGSTSLTKIDLGTLIFNNANTYSCPTNIAEGVLIVRDSQSLGQASALIPAPIPTVTVSNGATLQLEVEAGAGPNGTVLQPVNSLTGNPEDAHGRNLSDDSITHDAHRLQLSNPLLLVGQGVLAADGFRAGALFSHSGINVWTAPITSFAAGIGVALDPRSGHPTPDSSYFTADYSLTTTAAISGSTVTKLQLGHLIWPVANTYNDRTFVQRGWITAQDNRAFGARRFLSPQTPVTQTLQPETFVSSGAAIHLRTLTPTSPPLFIDENFILSGTGPKLPYKFISEKGALMNIGGDNVIGVDDLEAPTWFTYVALNGNVGIGVEQIAPLNPIGREATSHLTVLSWMRDDNISPPAVGTQGPGGITKFGSKRLVLEGDGTYSLATDIKEGIIDARHNTALGQSTSGTYTAASGSIPETYNQTTTTVQSAANLVLNSSSPLTNGGISSGIQVAHEQLVLNSPGQQIAVAGSKVPAPSQFYLTFTNHLTDVNPPSTRTTAGLESGLTAAEMEPELNKLPSVKGSEIQEITTGGVLGTTFTVTFNGQTTAVPVGGIPANSTALVVQNALLSLSSIRRNEVQDVVVLGGTALNSFTLTFNGQTTGSIAGNATPAAVRAALTALSNIGPLGLSVVSAVVPGGVRYTVTFDGPLVQYLNQNPMTATGTGMANPIVTTVQDGFGGTVVVTSAPGTGTPPGTIYTVNFGGDLSYQNLPQMSVAGTAAGSVRTIRDGLNGAIAVSESIGPGNGNRYTLTFLGDLANVNLPPIDVTAADGTVPTINTVQDGVGAQNEIQDAIVLGGTSSNGFKLTFNGQTTASIPGNATNLDVQNALNALPNVGAGGVTVVSTGVPGGFRYTVTFSGPLVRWQNHPLMTAAGLNGLATPVMQPVQDGFGIGEIQTVSVVAAQGSYTLTYKTETTPPIPITAPAVLVENYLNALPTLVADIGGQVLVSKAGNIYTAVFNSAHSADTPELVATPIYSPLGTPEVTISGNVTVDGYVSQASLMSATLDNTWRGPVVMNTGGRVATTEDTRVNFLGTVSDSTGNEIQQVTVLGGTAANSFTLTFKGQTTAPIPGSATDVDVQNALNAMAVIGAGGVVVTSATISGGVRYTVTFSGPTVRFTNQLLMTAAGAGGLATPTVQPVQDGFANAIGSDLVKRGQGELLLAGLNTFRGQTWIDEGLSTVANSGALGTTEGGTTVANNAQLQLQGSLTVAGESLTIQGTGVQDASTLKDKWFNVGPASSNGVPTSGNQTVSARVTSVTTDPQDPNVIYIATAGGGAWKTRDRGVTWVPLFDDTVDAAAVMYGGQIFVAPTNPNIVYFATGEGNGGPNGSPIGGVRDGFAGTGVYISTNAGITWRLLTGPNSNNPIYGLAITKLIVDPVNAQRIYIATGASSVINGGVNQIANNLFGTAVPGVYRYDGSAASPNWYNLTAFPSPNRATAPGQTPYDVAPPNNAGPDDDYRIMFPQNNSTWSDIALVAAGRQGNGDAGNTVNGFAWTLYAALGESQQRYFSNPTQAIFNAVYRTEDPAATFAPGQGPTWWIGNGTIFPVSDVTSSETTLADNSPPAVTDPDQRPTTTYYHIGPENDPVAPNPITHQPGRNEWIKISAVVTKYFNELPANVSTLPNNRINPTIQVYATNLGNSVDFFPFANPNINHTGEFLDIQRSGWDGGIGQNWTQDISKEGLGFSAPPFGLASTGGFALGRYTGTLISPSNTFGLLDITTAGVNDRLYFGAKDDVWSVTGIRGSANPTWTPFTQAVNSPADYFHALYIDPTTRNLLIGSDGGLWYDNTPAFGTHSFQNMNGNIAAAQINNIDPHPTDINQALAAAYNSGLQQFAGGLAWNAFTVPSPAADNRVRDAGDVRYDPKNPQNAFASVGGGLYRTQDGGASWQRVLTGSAENSFPVYVDPVNPNRVLVGGSAILETNSANAPLATLAGTFINLNGGATVALAAASYQGAFVADPGFPLVTDKLSNGYDPDTMYVTDGTTVRVTKNHGTTWIARSPFANVFPYDITFGGSLANTDVQQITVAPPGLPAGGNVTINTVLDGSTAFNEIQSMVVVGTAGTYRLRVRIPGFPNQTTGPIPFNATNQQVQDAINSLNGMILAGGTGSVTVSTGTTSNVITDVAVDPSNRDTVYVTVRQRNGSLGRPTVYRTTDAGLNWQDISGNGSSNAPVSYASTDTPIVVPDDGGFFTPGTPAVSTVNVVAPAGYTVTNLTVTVNVQMTYDGDLRFRLRSPSGAEIRLIEYEGGSGQDFTSTVLTDAAATPISAGTAPFGGLFQPEDPLATFNGLDPNGAWSLVIDDNFGGADQATLLNWTLDVTSAPQASGSLPFTQAWTVAVDPRSDTIYIGNDKGVWKLPNASSTNSYNWSRFGDSLPDVQVHDLTLNQTLNTLTASTYGRGMYQLFLTDYQPAPGGIRVISGNSVWTGDVMVTGDLTITADGTQEVQNGIAAASLDILGTISDLTPGNAAVITKTGLGTIGFSGSNTYGGQTLVQQGILRVKNPTALGVPDADSNTIVAEGAALEMASDVRGEPILTHGGGIASNGHFTGSLRSIANNNTYTGPLTLGSSSTIGVDPGNDLDPVINPGVRTDSSLRIGAHPQGSPFAPIVVATTQPGSSVAPLASEIQTVTVPLGTNFFNLTFNKQTTQLLPRTATTAQIQTALEALPAFGVSRDEVQDILITGTSGTFSLTVTIGADVQTVSGIPYNVTPSALQGLIAGLTNVGVGNVIVTQSPTATYRVRFTNALGWLNIDPMTTVGSPTLTATVSTITEGAGNIVATAATVGTDRVFTLAFRGTYLNTDVDPVEAGDSAIVATGTATPGGPGVSEIQTITVFKPAGSFNLTFDGATTGILSWTATQTDIQNALNGLATIGGVGGSVSVVSAAFGAGTRYTVTFGGTLQNTDVSQITASDVGTISDSGSNFTLAKELTGTLILASPNAVGGEIAVNQGALRVEDPNALGSFGPFSGTKVLDGAQVQIARNLITLVPTVMSSEPLSLSGTGIDVTGALRNVRSDTSAAGTNDNTWAGPITFTQNPGFFPQTNPGSRIAIRTDDSLIPGVIDTLNIDTNIQQDSTLASFGLIKVGSGRLNLMQSNSFTGTTEVGVTLGGRDFQGGSLRIENSTSLGPNALSNSVQTLSVVGLTGTYRLNFNGRATGNLNATSTAAQVEAALNALTSIGQNEQQTLTVTGAGTYRLTFDGVQTGPINTAGGTAAIDAALTGLLSVSHSERQDVLVTNSPGFFTLTFNGERTAPLPHDATAAQVQAELRNLPSIAPAGVTVAISPVVVPGATVFRVTFAGPLAPPTSGDQPQIVADTYVTDTVLDGGGGASEVQTFTQFSTTGTFILTFNGLTTIPLPFNATALQVQKALNALPSIGGVSGSVGVTEAPYGAGRLFTLTFAGSLADRDLPEIQAAGVGGPVTSVVTERNGLNGTIAVGGAAPNYTVTFGGDLASRDVPTMTAGSFTGSVNVVVGTGRPGAGVVVSETPSVGGKVFTVTFQRPLDLTVIPQIQSTNITPGLAVNVATSQVGGTGAVVNSGRNEIQDVLVAGGTALNSFTLTFNGQTTASIPGDASAAAVQAALTALVNIGPLGVSVVAASEFGSTRYTVTFDGPTLQYQNQNPMTATGVGITPIVTTVQNGSGGTIIGSIEVDGDPTNVGASINVIRNVVLNGTGVSGGVRVTSSPVSGGTRFDITFDGALGNADIPQLIAAGANGATASQGTTQNGSRAQDEIQTVTVTGSAGTFTISLNGQTTVPLAFNATAAQVQAALNALTSIGGSAGALVNVSGKNTYSGTVTLGTNSHIGANPDTSLNLPVMQDPTPLTVAAPSLTKVGQGTLILPNANAYGGLSNVRDGVLRIQNPQGVGATRNETQIVSTIGTTGAFALTFNGQTTVPLLFDTPASGGANPIDSVENALNALTSVRRNEVQSVSLSSIVNVATTTNGGGGFNEVQTVTSVGNAGSYTLTFNGATTVLIAANAPRIQVQNALNALPTINGAVTVTSVPFGATGTRYTITFGGTLANTNVSQLVASTFTITIGGQTTAALPIESNAAQVQAAVQALSTVGAGNATVTQSGSVFTITFVGALSYTDLAPISATGINGATAVAAVVQDGLNGNATVTTQLIPGGRQYAVTFGGSIANMNLPEILVTSAMVFTSTEVNGVLGSVSETQRVETFVTGAQTFTLTFNGQTTVPLAAGTQATSTPALEYPLGPADDSVRNALLALSSVRRNEVQSVFVQGTSGTFTLTFNGQTTSSLPFNAPATGIGSVQDALETLANIGTGNVQVTLTPGPGTNTYTVTFVAALGNQNVSQLAATGFSGAVPSVSTTTDGLNGDVTVTLDPPAVPPTARNVYHITFGGDLANQNVLQMTGASGATASFISPRTAFDGNGSETQIVNVTATGGTFRLRFRNQTTTALLFSATAADVEQALNALTTIGGIGGFVSVTKSGVHDGPGGANYTVHFGGTLAGTNLPLLSVPPNSGTPPGTTGGTVVVITTGNDGPEGTTVQSGATLQLQGDFVMDREAITLNGQGFQNQGALNVNNGHVTFQELNPLVRMPLFLATDASIGTTLPTDTLTFLLPITDQPQTLPPPPPSAGRNLDIYGPGTVTYAATQSGLLENTTYTQYTGTTTVHEGTLLLSQPAGNSILGPLVVGDGIGAPNSAVVRETISHQIADTVTVRVNSDGFFDLNGFTDTVSDVTMVGGRIDTGTGGQLTTGFIDMTGGTINIEDGATVTAQKNITMRSGAAVVGGAGSTLIGQQDVSMDASTMAFGNDGKIEVNNIVMTAGSTIDFANNGKLLADNVTVSGKHPTTNARGHIAFGDDGFFTALNVTGTDADFTFANKGDMNVASLTVTNGFVGFGKLGDLAVAGNIALNNATVTFGDDGTATAGGTLVATNGSAINFGTTGNLGTGDATFTNSNLTMGDGALATVGNLTVTNGTLSFGLGVTGGSTSLSALAVNSTNGNFRFADNGTFSAVSIAAVGGEIDFKNVGTLATTGNISLNDTDVRFDNTGRLDALDITGILGSLIEFLLSGVLNVDDFVLASNSLLDMGSKAIVNATSMDLTDSAAIFGDTANITVTGTLRLAGSDFSVGVGARDIPGQESLLQTGNLTMLPGTLPADVSHLAIGTKDSAIFSNINAAGGSITAQDESSISALGVVSADTDISLGNFATFNANTLSVADAAVQIGTDGAFNVLSTIALNNSQVNLGDRTLGSSKAISLTGSTFTIGTNATHTLGGDITANSNAAVTSGIFGPGNLSMGGENRTATVSNGPLPVDFIVTAFIVSSPTEVLFKTGPGRLEFAPINPTGFSGPVRVLDGDVQVDTLIGDVNLRSLTGSLSGNGTVGKIDGNPPPPAGGRAVGTVNPGVNWAANPAGVLHSGNVTWGSSTTFFVDVSNVSGNHPNATAGTDNDMLDVTGTVALNGATLNGSFNRTNVAVGDRFTILRSTGPITGHFAEPNGANVVFIDGHKFTVQYNTSTFPNTVVLTKVLANITSMNVSSTLNPATQRQPVTLTATMTPETGAGFISATNTVTFTFTNLDSPFQTYTGTVNVTANANQATFNTNLNITGQSFLPGGRYTVTATYNGDPVDFVTANASLTGNPLVIEVPVFDTPTATLPFISPTNSPGVQDSTFLDANVIMERGRLQTWSFNIYAGNLAVQPVTTPVRSLGFSGPGFFDPTVGDSKVEISATWNGRDSANVVVPNGDYTVFANFQDEFGNTGVSVPLVIVVDELSPTVTTPASVQLISPSLTGLVTPTSATITSTVGDPAFAGHPNGTFQSWTIEIRNSANAIVRTFSGTNTSVSQPWNGRNGSNVVVPDGVYTITIRSQDQAGNTTTSSPTSIVVLNSPPTLIGSTNPTSTVYGQTITINAVVSVLQDDTNVPFAVKNLLNLDTVEFYKNGTTLLGSAPINLVGSQYVATLTVPTFNAGTYNSMFVRYTGSNDFIAGNSQAFTHTVTPAPLTVTAANPVNKQYGDPVPTIDLASGYLTVSGLVNGDLAPNVVSGAAATTATQSSPVLPAGQGYPITKGGVTANSNYNMTFVDGLLVVTKAPLTIHIDDKERPFRTANPPLTFSATGLLLGDPASVVTGFTLQTTAVLTSPPGTYPIFSVGTPTAQNYTITNFTAGSITPNGTLKIIPTPTPLVIGPGSGTAPLVKVYSPTGVLQNSFFAFSQTFTGGVRTATGDFNRDGVEDIVVGTGPGAVAQVRVIDGNTGLPLFNVFPFEQFTGGVFVTSGDIDGDGADELVITPDQGGGPRIVAFRGLTFAPFISYFGINDPNFRGGARAAVGDLNGDGFGDIAISAGFDGGPRVSLWDGKALSALQFTNMAGDFYVYDPNLRNGAYVAIGDVDGDGKAELITGAGPGGGPHVKVYKGAELFGPGGPASAGLLANFLAGDPDNRGGVRVAVKSLDNDLLADLAIGAGDMGGNTATTYLGVDLAAGVLDSYYDIEAYPGFLNGVFVG